MCTGTVAFGMPGHETDTAMPRGSHLCTTSGCPVILDAADPRSRCATHSRDADRARGTATQRGYGHAHRTRFRPGVLAKHPTCQCHDPHRDPALDHPPGHCPRWSTVADHWPLGRDELVAAGMDPDDPAHGRGLCASCDRPQTARRQPGGWNRTSPTRDGHTA